MGVEEVSGRPALVEGVRGAALIQSSGAHADVADSDAGDRGGDI